MARRRAGDRKMARKLNWEELAVTGLSAGATAYYLGHIAQAKGTATLDAVVLLGAGAAGALLTEGLDLVNEVSDGFWTGALSYLVLNPPTFGAATSSSTG